MGQQLSDTQGPTLPLISARVIPQVSVISKQTEATVPHGSWQPLRAQDPSGWM